MARALRDNTCQQLPQCPCSLCREHPPGAAVGQRGQRFTGRFIQSAFQKEWLPPDTARRNGVYHGSNLDRCSQQLPLPKAEIGKSPAGCECFRLRQLTGSRAQGVCQIQRPAKAEADSHFPHPLRAKLLPQPDKISVAAFLQGGCQIHFSVRDTSGTAEHLPIHNAIARAIPHKARLPRFQRCGSQYRLENRTHRIGLKCPVHKRAVRSIQAGGDIFRVKARCTGTGPHFCTGRIQYQNAAALHRLDRHGFCRALDGPGESQLNPHCAAVRFYKLRLCPAPELSLCVDRTDQLVLCPGAGEQILQRCLQPCDAVPLAIEIAQQGRRQRGIPIAARDGIAPRAHCRDIPRHLHQKRPGGVPFLVEHCLTGLAGIRVKFCVASLPGQTKRQPLLPKPGEQVTIAIVKIAPPGRER